ncbi:hypothetical protein [Sporocytophaga myxococcoides]|uniref:hypothetical protein n=1 Tax=Sporocytophaga myxococcoides TaxID=153721 RepID=UPI00040EA7AD|nr:hypothetical protein [Sporocytophaga myxococcoides]
MTSAIKFIKGNLAATLIGLLFLLVSCKKEKQDIPAWDIVTGDYKGLLYISKPKDSLGVAQPYYDQTVQIHKVGTDEYRFTPSNSSIPSFNFKYDSKTSMSSGVIYNEYYYNIYTQTNNGVTVTSNSLVYDKTNPKIGFSIFNGTGDTLWLYTGNKQ